jgi:hypothetical protein
MLDSITVSELEWAYASHHPDVLAGYVAGSWPDFAPLEQFFAKVSGLHLLSISPFASVDADCLDVEKGDATIPQVYGWFKRQQARHLWRPVIYTSADSVNALISTMKANGFPRASYRLWSAHYTDTAHICGPTTCKYTNARGVVAACDATQWTDHAFGRNLDESVLLPDFFPAPKPPPAHPASVPPKQMAADGKLSLHAAAAAYSTSTDRALWLMARDPAKAKGYGHLQAAYIRAGKWADPMPSGMTFWVG